MKLDRFDATPAPAWRQFNVFCHAVLTDWSQLDELLAALPHRPRQAMRSA